jgi:hypothetical protein
MTHRCHYVARRIRTYEPGKLLLVLFVVGISCDLNTNTPSDAPTENPFAGRVARSHPTGGSGNTPSLIDSVRPQDDCDRGCLALSDCLCPTDDDECISVADCSADCRFDEREAAYACLASLRSTCKQVGIEQSEIDACLAIGAPDLSDTCGQGCLALDDCDLCYTDEDDNCLNLAQCAEACRSHSGEDQAACVLEVSGCDRNGLDACFAEDPEPLPSGGGTGGVSGSATGAKAGANTGGSGGTAMGGAAGSGEGGSTPLTLDEAVHEVFRAICGKYQECLPYHLISSYGTLASCISRSELGEHAYLELPGVTETAATLTACASAVDALSCSEYHRTWPSECTPAGALANGEACVSNGQCQSLWCHMSSEQCGTCTDPPEERRRLNLPHTLVRLGPCPVSASAAERAPSV